MDDIMPRRDWLRIRKILNNIQLRPDHEKLGSDYGVEKLGSDHKVEDWTMQADNLVLCHWVEFSIVAATVKFCRSWPANMNWDLKHHEMCQTLWVLLAWYNYERLLRTISLLMLKNWSQKLIIKRSYLKNRVTCMLYLYLPVFTCLWFACVYVQYTTYGEWRNKKTELSFLSLIHTYGSWEQEFTTFLRLYCKCIIIIAITKKCLYMIDWLIDWLIFNGMSTRLRIWGVLNTPSLWLLSTLIW